MNDLKSWIIRLIPDDYPCKDIFRQVLTDSHAIFESQDALDRLASAYHEVMALHQTEKYQLGLYLGSLAIVDESIKEKAYFWFKRNIYVMKRLLDIYGRETTIDKLCVRFRLANAQERHRWLLLELESCVGFDNPVDVYQQLLSIENEYKNKGQAYEAGRVSEVRIAYEAAATTKSKTDRSSSLRDKPKVKQAPTRRNSYATTRIFKPLSKPNYRIDGEESHYDSSSSNRFFEIDIKEQKKRQIGSNDISKYQLRNHVRHMVKRDMEVITDPNVLPMDLIAAVCRELYGLANQGDIAAAILYLSLILGIPLDREDIDVSEFLKQFHATSKEYLFKITLDVSKSDSNIPVLHRLNTTNSFYLKLDPVIMRGLALAKDSTITYVSRQELLKEIKEKCCIHTLTQTRVGTSLHSQLRRVFANGHIADLICNVSAKHAPAIYYTSYKVEVLQRAHQKLLNSFLNNQVAPSRRSDRSQSLQHTVGSHRVIDSTAAAAFMDKLKQEAESQRGFIGFHNALTTWMWHALLLQTAARPVNHFPGTLNDIDLKEGLIMISDKERREVASHRIIPLSGFSVSVIQQYVKYLKTVKECQGLMNGKLALHIQKVLDGELPLLFYGESPVTPSQVQNNIPADLPRYPLNWPRHYCRNIFEKTVSDNLTKAIYGHEEFEMELLNPMSSLSLAEYKKVAVVFNKIAQDIKLQMPKNVVEVASYL